MKPYEAERARRSRLHYKVHMDKALKKEKEMDNIATFMLKNDNVEYNDEIVTYTIVISAKGQNIPEVKETKAKEIENLMKCDVFEEVEDYR